MFIKCKYSLLILEGPAALPLLQAVSAFWILRISMFELCNGITDVKFSNWRVGAIAGNAICSTWVIYACVMAVLGLSALSKTALAFPG